ncbi:uncharacterized protein LOC126901668 isoform X2 [Daktulosphaira vitifoliae]|uniref:uncharacterized protein LOC126901668 isoform X2 n=1 Tax=Daktulosphaira vitifoliae TaxID=58002 RepID=UPI0021A9D381|nr:uncharacterized protein LOC126901668 isoform X2 [Daktulosphaira vitifoliae]
MIKIAIPILVCFFFSMTIGNEQEIQECSRQIYMTNGVIFSLKDEEQDKLMKLFIENFTYEEILKFLILPDITNYEPVYYSNVAFDLIDQENIIQDLILRAIPEYFHLEDYTLLKTFRNIDIALKLLSRAYRFTFGNNKNCVEDGIIKCKIIALLKKTKNNNIQHQNYRCTKDEYCVIKTVYNDGNITIKRYFDEYYEPWNEYAAVTIVNDKITYDFFGNLD